LRSQKPTGVAARKKGRSPHTCAECERRDDDRLRVMKLLTDTVEKMEAKLQAEDFKPTIGDFLKLVQIEKEFGQEMAREIKVTWVETPAESEPGK
jgi:hypothetical protein